MQVRLVIYPTLDRDLARLTDDSNADQTLRQHTQVPIEGVGVVHVLTEVPNNDPGHGFSDVTLARYNDRRLAEHIPITGSVCESAMAPFMHEHWCDLQRLVRCVQGDSKALYILDIDWELDDDIDQPHELPDECQGSDPGLTPRISALIARAESRFVRTPGLDTLLGPQLVEPA